jgi:hypothetical protein
MAMAGDPRGLRASGYRPGWRRSGPVLIADPMPRNWARGSPLNSELHSPCFT